MFFDKKASITRLTVTAADSDKEDYQAVSGLEDLDIHIQPASAETIALVDGVFGKTFDLFTTRSGMVDGDRITVSGVFIDDLTVNKELTVLNVRPWYFAPIPHFEITCQEVEE